MARPASGRAVAQRLRGAEGRFPGWPSQSQRGRTRAVPAPPEGEPRARGNRRFCSAPGAKWLPLEGKLSQPISREAVTDEVEPAAFDRLSTNGDADTSSVIRLAGDAGCHLPLQGKALKRPRPGTIVPCCANVPACAVKGANMQKMYGDVAKCCDVAVHCFQLIASFCREGQAPPLRNRRTFSRRTHVSAELRFRVDQGIGPCVFPPCPRSLGGRLAGPVRNGAAHASVLPAG